MNLTAKQQDTFMLGAALAVALASCGWFGWRAWTESRIQHDLPAVQTSSAPYAPPAIDAPKVLTETWAPPPAQGRGADWVYEVFTPPEIFYDARTQQFTVNAPKREIEAKPVPPPQAFGLELIEVRRDLFRLQLIGYVGGEGNYRGTFENALTTETFLAGAGRRIPALGLEIISLEVSRQQVYLPGSMATSQLVATATVRDERTGETVNLNSLERCLTGAAIGVFATSGESGGRRELRPGESFKLGAATYKILKIQLAPPSAVVTKEAPDLDKPDLRTLSPTATPPPPQDSAPPPSR